MTATERTRHAQTCPRCQGTGIYIHTTNGGVSIVCDHTFSTAEIGPDADEMRIARLEDRIAELEREAAFLRRLVACGDRLSDEIDACKAILEAHVDRCIGRPLIDMVRDTDSLIRSLKERP